MIVICGSVGNRRDEALRERIFTAGYPCTVADAKELGKLLPVKLIVCYFDAFNELRHGPFDKIFAIVIGNGFVNSALNAIRVNDEDEALEAVRDFILKLYGIGEKQRLPFGVLTNDSVFLSMHHLELFGNIVIPKTSEYMIFKYLYAFSDEVCYFSPEKIRRFCYVLKLNTDDNLEGNIAVHISNLNRAIRKVYGKPLIRSVRYKGYYFDKSRL